PPRVEGAAMTLNYLVGPVSAEAAWRGWSGPRRRGECRAFNAGNDLDLTVRMDDGWDAVCRRLPDGWRPDFVALDLAFATIPPCLWQAPVPLVGLARDWDVQFHAYRHLLPHCDYVLADLTGVEVLRRACLTPVAAANLCGLPSSLLGLPADDRPR